MPGYFDEIVQGLPDRTNEIEDLIGAAIYGGTANQSGGNKRVIQLPEGNLRMKRPLHASFGQSFGSCVIQGHGPKYRGANAFNGTAIFADFDHGQAFSIQGARHTAVRNMAIIGRNIDWVQDNRLGHIDGPLNGIDDTDPANWVDPALPSEASGRYSPYAAFAIDGYSGPRPEISYPDVSYPDFLGLLPQYNKVTSSGVNFEDVLISGFVAGVANQPCDHDANGDFTTLSRVLIDFTPYALTFGNSQSRSVALDDVRVNYALCALATNVHGRQNGKLQGLIKNLHASSVIDLLSFANTSVAGPLTFLNCYSEALWRIGRIGVATSSETALKFITCTFDFGAQTDQRGVPASCMTGDGAAVDIEFDGCTINNVPSVFVVEAQGCRLTGGTQIIAAERKGPAAPSLAEAAAHNVLAGGAVSGFFSAEPAQRIKFSPFDMDTGAKLTSVMANDGMKATARNTCIPNHVRLAQPRDLAPYCPAVKMPAPIAIAKSASPLTYINGRELSMTLQNWPEAKFAILGPERGDCILDELTRTLFIVMSRSGSTIIARAQNNYRNGQLIQAVSLTSGFWYVLNSRLYTPPKYLRADLTSASRALTNAGQDDGDSAWVVNDVLPGDYLYVSQETDRFVSPYGARVDSVVDGTLTLAAAVASGRSQIRKRLSLFIRSPAQ